MYDPEIRMKRLSFLRSDEDHYESKKASKSKKASIWKPSLIR